MRTLKDVYIKVNKSNHEKIAELLQSDNLPYGTIYFNFDNIKSWSIRERKAEKVSLSQLKRLIDTIPTREEIKRLKQQISAYKTNYDKVVKHSLSKEGELELLRVDNEELSKLYLDLGNETSRVIEHLEKKLDIQADLIRDKNAQLEQLKNRKFWQIWK